MKKVLIINGANMNLLGVRDRAQLGISSLDDIDREIGQYASNINAHVDTFQSNHEGDIINKIQQASEKYKGIIINPGSFVHYSVGIKEAIDGLSMPCIEVHLGKFLNKPNNKSEIVSACTGFISGFGRNSYLVALDAMMKII